MSNFVIGIGSQRAGSTLLNKVLTECTDIFMHPLKELHYYDTMFGVRDVGVLKEFSLRQIDREVDRLVKATDHSYIDKKYKCYLRSNKMLLAKDVNDFEYIDLYRPCVKSSKLLGEITPEYMILPSEGIQKMAVDIGNESKIIMITRDPVDRFISAFKLLKNYGNKEGYDKSKVSEEIFETIDQLPGWVEQQRRLSDYDLALKKYRCHFSNILKLSYEEMVANPRVLSSQLSDFLGLHVSKSDVSRIFEKKVNAMGDTGEINLDALEKIKNIMSISEA